MPVKAQLQGQKFGRLLVVSEAESVGKSRWNCVCDCGNQKTVQVTHLRRGKIQSCGCWQKERAAACGKDRTGQRYGRLLVLAKTDKRRHGKIVWHCQCDCGTQVEMPSINLTLGTQSCGCYRKEVTAGLKYSHGQAGTRAYQQYHSVKRYCAKKHRTPPWADQVAIQQVYELCPKGLAVDHIIPLQGELVSGLHVPNNLQYLTREANSAKNNKFEPQFVIR